MNTPAQAELGRGTPKTYKMVRVGQPPQTPHQDSNGECRIVDMVVKTSGEVDYVDGKRVPGNFVNIDYLREQEKSSPRSCLRLFVTSSVKIQDIEDFRV